MSDNYLIHFGNKNSGRYPRGSGERPHQHDGLLSRFKKRKEDTTKNYKTNEKDVSKMSDKELDHHVERLRKQKEAKELSHFLVDKHAFDKPKPDSIMVKAGRRIGEVVLTGAGLYLLSSIVSGEFDRKELGKSVALGRPVFNNKEVTKEEKQKK